MVERHIWDVDVVGSNPVTQTCLIYYSGILGFLNKQIHNMKTLITAIVVGMALMSCQQTQMTEATITVLPVK